MRECAPERFPYGQLPVLEHEDGTVVAQSKAILRYVSKHCRLYPSDKLNAAIVDQWVELHTEFMQPILLSMFPARFGIVDFDKDAHRTWVRETHIPKYFAYIDEDLKSGAWLGRMDKCSMADTCWYPTLKFLREGKFDGVDASVFLPYANVTAFMSDMSIELSDEE